MSMPRGNSPGRRSRVATLSTSLSMLARTPGYCTLIARSRPSGVTARCTCPMEAAAKGRTSKRAKRLYQPGPHSAFSTVCSCLGGMWRASSRIRARIAVSSSGSTSPVSIDSICPSFSAAPRRCDSPSVSRKRVGRRQQQLRQIRPLALRQRAQAARRNAARNARGHATKAQQPRRASRRHRGAVSSLSWQGASPVSAATGVRLRNRRRCQR